MSTTKDDIQRPKGRSILTDMANLNFSDSTAAAAGYSDDDTVSPVSGAVLVAAEEEDEAEGEPDVLAFDTDYEWESSGDEGVSIADEWDCLSDVHVGTDTDELCSAVMSEAGEEVEDRVAIPRLQQSMARRQVQRAGQENEVRAEPVVKKEEEPQSTFNRTPTPTPADRRVSDICIRLKPQPEEKVSAATETQQSPETTLIKTEPSVAIPEQGEDLSNGVLRRRRLKKKSSQKATAEASRTDKVPATSSKKKKKKKTKNAPAPVKTEKIDLTRLRPIEEYFLQYHDIYKFKPQNTLIGEYKRLSAALAKNGIPADRSMFCGATLREFRFGTEEKIRELGLSGGLAPWHVVCLELGATAADLPNLSSKKKCTQFVKRHFINIFDYMDARYKKQPVKKFKSHGALVAHIRTRKKAFVKDVAKQDEVVKALLKMVR